MSLTLLDFSRYRTFLGVRSSRQLLGASFLVGMGSSARGLALVLLIRQESGSFALAGGAAGLSAIGAAACAPLRGRMVDRYGQAPVILPMAILNAAAWVGVATVGAHAAPVLLMTLTFLAGASFPPIYACARAAWSSALRAEPALLQSAYAVNSAVQNVATILGPLFAASGITLVSPAWAVLATTLLTLAASLLLITSALSRAVTAGGELGSRLGSALRSRGLRALLLVMVMFGMILGALEVAIPAVAERWSSALGAGALVACFIAGDIAGALGYGARGTRTSRVDQLLLSFVITGAVFAALVVLPAAFLAILLFGAGIATAPIVINGYHLLDDVAPAGSATESFTWLATGQLVGIALGTALAGQVVDSFGPRTGFAVAAMAAGGAVAILLGEGSRLGLPAPGPSAVVAG